MSRDYFMGQLLTMENDARMVKEGAGLIFWNHLNFILTLINFDLLLFTLNFFDLLRFILIYFDSLWFTLINFDLL